MEEKNGIIYYRKAHCGGSPSQSRHNGSPPLHNLYINIPERVDGGGLVTRVYYKLKPEEDEDKTERERDGEERRRGTLDKAQPTLYSNY